MPPPARIRSARAPLIFAALGNVRLDSQMRSRLACDAVPKASGISSNKADRCRGLRRVKSESERCAQASLHPAATARLRAASVRHRESRPQEKYRRRGWLSVARLQSEWFFDQRDLDPPEMHRPHAKKIPRRGTEKIPPSPSSRFFVPLLTK